MRYLPVLSVLVVVCLLGAAGVYCFTQAGDMEPPGPPAPTMVTLQEIYEIVSAYSANPAELAKTGQTQCYDGLGYPIDCTGTGQDGEYQYGVSVVTRFTVNGDGTVTDNLRGLVWLQDANCFGLRNWTDALSDANALADPACGLTDGSVAGDWRLPNVRELHSLIDYETALPSDHPFSGMQPYPYWSSTTHRSFPVNAWCLFFGSDRMQYCDKNVTYPVWPVRGGVRQYPPRRRATGRGEEG